jgi:RNA polymerase sigma-70 factor (ECF subfamily)
MQSQNTAGDRSGDELLLRRIRDGDFEAVEELYNQYNRIAFALALRLLNDAGQAEDAIQEVFVRIWRQPDYYDPARGRFATWLLSVVHHQCIDQLRKKRHQQLSLDQEESQERLNYLAEKAPALEEEVWLKLKRQSVRNALDRLPEEQRKLIELAFFGGYTHNEIAVQTGQPLGTVKSRIRQGLLKLKTILQNLQFESNV